jgi:hypothetical protein
MAKPVTITSKQLLRVTALQKGLTTQRASAHCVNYMEQSRSWKAFRVSGKINRA